MPDSEPLGYAIAEQRPCPFDDFDEHACAANRGLPCETDDEPDNEPDNLAGTCRGDGTRWVVTDVKVEPVQHYCERGDDEDAYSDDVPCDPDRADYWLRVRS